MEAPPTPLATDLNDGWFTEYFTPHESHRHHFKKILVQKQTRFQKAILADSYSFGRCLILDGELQSAQRDEFIYHECLVHPAMVLHPRPRRVLIMGGGEGATVREVLRHPSVQQVTMVDIDGEVVEFCRRYLRDWHQGTLAHPKTRLLIDDARKFILRTKETFDVIISDLPTPTKGGPLQSLYTVEFYRKLIKRLTPGGVFVAQAGSGHMLQFRFHAVLARTLSAVFKKVRPYYAFVPSFDVPWAFLMATSRLDPMRLTAKAVDQRLGQLKAQLQCYDGQTHEGLFRVPKYLRTHLERETQVITEAKPIHF
jgi:spermidine synthase